MSKRALLIAALLALPLAAAISSSCSLTCEDTYSCPCRVAADCDFLPETDCTKRTCELRVCRRQHEPAGTPCSTGVCDGEGECVPMSGTGGGGTGGGTGGGACTTCGDDCVDLASHAHHCGACGHDCIYGACEEGMCQPFTIAIASSLVKSFAVGPDHVYWHAQDSGVIARVDKLGTAQGSFWGMGPENVGHIVAGPDALCWHSAGSDSEIRCQPYSIGPPVTVMEDVASLTSLAVDGSATVFGALGSPANVLFYLDDFNPVPIDTVSVTHHMAVGDTVIGCLSGTESSTELRFGPKSPGTLSSAPAAGALGLTCDGEAFFWHTPDEIVRFVTAPPSHEVVAGGIYPGAIAVDSSAGYVYWLDIGSGELWRTGISQPAAPEKVADSPDLPEKLLAVDETSIYWVSGSRNIVKLVKPVLPTTAGMQSRGSR